MRRWCMPPEILRHYVIADGVSVIPLGNHGGFSGARLWRIVGPQGEYCLRAWPSETAAQQLRQIHQLIDQARDAGLSFVPRILRADNGESIVSHQDRFWEVAAWLPGKADFHQRPTPERLAAA